MIWRGKFYLWPILWLLGGFGRSFRHWNRWSIFL